MSARARSRALLAALAVAALLATHTLVGGCDLRRPARRRVARAGASGAGRTCSAR